MPGDVVRFRSFELDCERRELRLGGQPRHLRARSFDVLHHLVRNAGRVVSKQSLFDEVWGGTAVTDDALVQCLVDIRRALGDDGEIIRTIRGRGYLLDAQVQASEGQPAPPEAAAPPVPPRPSRWAGSLVVIGLALVTAVLAVWARARPVPAPGRVTPQATMDARAEELLVEGQRALQARSQVGLQRARQLFQSSVQLDDNYAPAHAALSNTLTILHAFGVERPSDVLPGAERHARRAIQLDPTLPMAWHALAHNQVHWDRDWAAAEANYRRAQALDPRDENPRFLLAHLLAGLGRPDEALAESASALALYPDSVVLNGSAGIVHYLARRYEEALPYFDRALALEPGYSTASFWKALTLAALRRADEAMEAALRARRDAGNAPAWVVGYVHAVAGRPAQAIEVLRALEAHAASHYVPPIEFAYLHAALGHRDEALRWLERSAGERSRWIELMVVDPILDPLRDHPRFSEVLARMGLPR